MITSTVTYNREVRAIFEARCVSCHHSGGAAFSLTSYADARPWAKAIEEEVLRRRMPPWGAVRGFGELRNDPTLSMTEMQQIAEWAEGGAPEGEPTGESAASQPEDSIDADRVVVVKEVSGVVRLDRTVALDALRVTEISEAPSFKIIAELPGGVSIPLLWVDDPKAARQRIFRLGSRVQLPIGTAIRGLPANTTVQFLSATPSAAGK